MKVIHIGLGKTGTTSMQRYVFPYLSTLLNIEYNPYSLWQELRKDIAFECDRAFRKDLRTVVDSHENLLISLESLASTNPHLWQERADKNRDIFGEDSVILLTLREPLSYLKSVYQQTIHQGMVRPPHEFFCSPEEYRLLESLTAKSKLELYDIEKLDYNWLISLYRDRFKNVIVITPKHLKSLKFIQNIYGLSNEDYNSLKLKADSAKIANKSYSSTAMRLTFIRERMLKKFGVTTLALNNLHARDRELLLLDDEKGLLALKPELSHSFLTKLYNLVNWRWLMQNGLPRLIPYKPYKLPEDIKMPDERYLSCISALEQEEKNLDEIISTNAELLKDNL